MALAVALAAGCGSKAKLAGNGQECYLATDCAAGLVCLPTKAGNRVCGNDLSGVQKEPPPAMRQDAGDDAGDAGEAGAGDDEGGAPGDDAGGAPGDDGGGAPGDDAGSAAD